jgi:hypothetical protein
MIYTQQLIEFGVKRQVVPPICALNEQRHHEHGQRRHCVPIECETVKRKRLDDLPPDQYLLSSASSAWCDGLYITSSG